MNDPFPRWFRWLTAAAAGALLWSVVPQALDALSTPAVPLSWWLARAFGLVAYLALFLSMLFGVFVGARGAGGLLPKAGVLELHRAWALAALVATAIHVLLLITNAHAGIDGFAALVPFASERLRGPVALGSIALWGLLVLALSTGLRRQLPPLVWRAIHGLAFGTFVLSLVHAVTAGTDTPARVVGIVYLGTATLLLGAILQRVLLATAPTGGTRGALRSEDT